MALSKAQQEALQQDYATCPAESIGTFMKSLLPAELATQRKASLVDAATKLLTEHWNEAMGQEVVFSAHDSLDLMARTYAKLQADLHHAEVLAVHVASLKERIANLNKDQTTSCPFSNSSTTAIQATSNNTLNNASQVSS